MLTFKPDMVMDSLLLRSGMGKLVFWSVQDPNYPVDIWCGGKFETFKMLDSVMNPVKVVSQAGNGTASLRAGKSRPYGELINCVLCTCDCSVSVGADQCIDYDGVIDALSDFREGVSRGQGGQCPSVKKYYIFHTYVL